VFVVTVGLLQDGVGVMTRVLGYVKDRVQGADVLGTNVLHTFDCSGKGEGQGMWSVVIRCRFDSR